MHGLKKMFHLLQTPGSDKFSVWVSNTFNVFQYINMFWSNLKIWPNHNVFKWWRNVLIIICKLTSFYADYTAVQAGATVSLGASAHMVILETKLTVCHLYRKKELVLHEVFLKVHFQKFRTWSSFIYSPATVTVSVGSFFFFSFPSMVPISPHSYSEHCTNGFLEEWKRTLSPFLPSNALARS